MQEAVVVERLWNNRICVRVSDEMTEKPTLYTSLPPNLTRQLASIEAGRSYLAACVHSWKAHFRVISLNSGPEIEILEEQGYDVEYQRIIGSRPRVGDFLRAILLSGQPLAALMNADVFLMDYQPFWKMVMQRAIEGLVAIRRMNIDPLDLRVMGWCPYGFDGMIFNAGLLSRMNFDVDLPIGHPWWDYWFPLAYAEAGGKLMISEIPVMFHVDHPINWQPSEFVSCGSRAISSLSAGPGKLPQDLRSEVKRLLLSGAITYDALQAFAELCFGRLIEMAEKILCPWPQSDDDVLLALAPPDSAVSMRNWLGSTFSLEFSNERLALELTQRVAWLALAQTRISELETTARAQSAEAARLGAAIASAEHLTEALKQALQERDVTIARVKSQLISAQKRAAEFAQALQARTIELHPQLTAGPKSDDTVR